MNHRHNFFFFLTYNRVLILCVCLLSFSAASDVAAQIDARHMTELVRASEHNGAAMHAKMQEYSFNSKMTLRMTDKKGKVKENVYESYPPSSERQAGTPILYILVTKENSPVKPETIARDRIRAHKQLEKFRNQTGKGNNVASSEGHKPSYYKFSSKIANLFGIAAKTKTLNPSSILQNCQFASPIAERLGGRDSIMMEFSDCSSDGLPAEERFISNLIGKVLIDADDKVLIRFEGWTQAAGAKSDLTHVTPHADAEFIYEQVRVSGGQWLPQRVVIGNGTNIGFKFLLGVEDIASQIEFSDYSRIGK
jgi:hypothetical protein